MVTKSYIKSLELEIDARSPLKHPFYQMWSRGDLTIEHLKTYSQEYFTLVKAIPRFVEIVSNYISEPSLRSSVTEENLKEETDHVELWIKFASSLGLQRDALEQHTPSPKTMLAVSNFEKIIRSSYLRAVAAMYAYEFELPKISTSKIDGLEKFYNLANPDALEYFLVHKTVDIKHAAMWRNILEKSAAPDEDHLLKSAVTDCMQAQALLLDSVMEQAKLQIAC